jgi:small-conductance mechanosensitive channel
MKRPVFFALLLLSILVVSVPLHAAVQPATLSPKDQEGSGMDAAELQGIIQVLEDPASARKLAESLRTLVEAQKVQVPSEKKEEEGQDEGLPRYLTTVLESYQAYQGKALSALTRLEKETRGLAARYRNLKRHLSRQENRRILVAFWVQFMAALLAGLGAWLGLRRLTRRWERRLPRKDPRGLGGRIGRALLAASFQLYPWAGLFLFVVLFFLFFPQVEKFRTTLLLGILAVGLYGGLKRFVQSLFSPEDPELRILPLQDESAVYAYVWSRRALLFTLWMLLMIIPGAAYGLTAWSSLFDAVLKTGLVVMLAVVLAQQQEAIQLAVGLHVREGDALWKARAKRILGYMLGKFYILAVVYMGFVIALSLLGFREAYRYMIHATGRTLFIVVIATGLCLLWGLLFRRLFEVSRSLRERYPDLEAQVNRYVNLLEDGGSALIVLIAFLSVLEAWGLNIYAFLSSNSLFVKALLQIPLIVLGAILLIQFGRLLITGLERDVALRMLAARTTSPGEAEKRVSTLGRICRSVLYLVTVTISVMMVLDRIGLDIKPMLAGAGIVGLAVGFGAQNLVKDIISGLFFIIENRIRVGDVAILNGTGGLVEQVNLRTTVLRALDGTVHVFPNGSINSLSNMTHDFSYYLFNVGVAYKEDTDRVTAVLQEIGQGMLEDDAYKDFILEPLEILGVDQFADSAVVIKARIKTAPIKQWLVGREMNRRIKKRFDEEGIEIPFPHRTFYFGDASKSIAVALQGQQEDREALKGLFREILEESKA